MLAEHEFVTTLEEEEALHEAEGFLRSIGFEKTELTERNGGLTMRRGHPRPKATASCNELPQEVRLTFDRGRVSIAASIQEHQKPTEEHRHLVVSLEKGLEARLGRSEPLESARQPFDEASDFAHRRHRRRTFWRRLLFGILLFLVLGVITLAIVGATLS